MAFHLPCWPLHSVDREVGGRARASQRRKNLGVASYWWCCFLQSVWCGSKGIQEGGHRPSYLRKVRKLLRPLEGGCVLHVAGDMPPLRSCAPIGQNMREGDMCVSCAGHRTVCKALWLDTSALTTHSAVECSPVRSVAPPSSTTSAETCTSGQCIDLTFPTIRKETPVPLPAPSRDGVGGPCRVVWCT